MTTSHAPCHPTRRRRVFPWSVVIVSVVTVLLAGVPAQADVSEDLREFVAPVPSLTTSNEQSSATPGGVAAAISQALSAPSLGNRLSGIVVDTATGQALYSTAPDQSTIPASTLKLVTAASVLNVMGPNARLRTVVQQTDDSRLIVVGGGDPDLDVDNDGRGASLTVLASYTAQSLRQDTSPTALGTPANPITVQINDSLFTGPVTSPSWDPILLNECLVGQITALRISGSCQPTGDPSISAGEIFADLLRQAGFTVNPDVTRTQVAAREIASVQSMPLATLVEDMLIESNNTAAEMLGHVAAGQDNGNASFAGAAAMVTTSMQSLSIPMPQATIVDSSGLSRDNRLTPQTIGDLLVYVAQNRMHDLWPVMTGLPVAGFDGTLEDRFPPATQQAGRGVVRAKTGTLTGVSGLAGQVVTADEQLLVFAFLSDSVDNTVEARNALDAATVQLATCGCQTPPPQ